jgi:hypothetical protein
MSREGRARHGDVPPYGGELWLESRITKWLHDFDEALQPPGHRPLRLLAYHTHRSDRSRPGFPDWIFAGPGGVLPAELKGPSEKLAPDQLDWFEMLTRARVLHPPELWRPDDYRRGYIGAKLRYIAGLGIAERDRLGMPDARDTAPTDQD